MVHTRPLHGALTDLRLSGNQHMCLDHLNRLLLGWIKPPSG